MQIPLFRYPDSRGELISLYRYNTNLPTFVEDRISKSKKGVIRGFHGDCCTGKLIYCLSGEFKLVAYNLYTKTREEYYLNENSNFAVYLPPNTLNAHQALTDCTLFYKWSKIYSGPENQISVHFNDETINPNWDLSLTQIVSDRDLNAKKLKDLNV